MHLFHSNRMKIPILRHTHPPNLLGENQSRPNRLPGKLLYACYKEHIPIEPCAVGKWPLRCHLFPLLWQWHIGRQAGGKGVGKQKHNYPEGAQNCQPPSATLRSCPWELSCSPGDVASARRLAHPYQLSLSLSRSLSLALSLCLFPTAYASLPGSSPHVWSSVAWRADGPYVCVGMCVFALF